MAEARGCALSSGESAAAGAVLDLQEKDPLPAANTPRAESTVSFDLIRAAPKHPNSKVRLLAEEESPVQLCLLSSGESTVAGAVLEVPAADIPRAESTVSSDPILAAPKHPNPKRKEITEESPTEILPLQRGCLLSSGESAVAGAVLDLEEEELPANTPRAAESTVSSDPIPAVPSHLNPKREFSDQKAEMSASGTSSDTHGNLDELMPLMQCKPLSEQESIYNFGEMEAQGGRLPSFGSSTMVRVDLLEEELSAANAEIASADSSRVFSIRTIPILEHFVDIMETIKKIGEDAGGWAKKITVTALFVVAFALYVSAWIYSNNLGEKLAILATLIFSFITIITFWWQ